MSTIASLLTPTALRVRVAADTTADTINTEINPVAIRQRTLSPALALVGPPGLQTRTVEADKPLVLPHSNNLNTVLISPVEIPFKFNQRSTAANDCALRTHGAPAGS